MNDFPLLKTTYFSAHFCKTTLHSSMLPKNNNEVYPTAMNRMKTLVFKERVRVYEWMKDYDKLRSGSIPASSFRRALDLCGAGIVLVEPEIISIMENYVCTKKQNHIRYLDFCGELETVFTKVLVSTNTKDTKHKSVNSCVCTKHKHGFVFCGFCDKTE